MPEPQISTFLMFQGGGAEEAVRHYTSLLPNSHIEDIQHYGADGPGAPGAVNQATFTLVGQRFMCIDSPLAHDFDFTPSMSLYVDCTDESEFDRLYQGLGEGGQDLMPPGDYGFSQLFAWVVDRHGVSWQINVPDREESSTDE